MAAIISIDRVNRGNRCCVGVAFTFLFLIRTDYKLQRNVFASLNNVCRAAVRRKAVAIFRINSNFKYIRINFFHFQCWTISDTKVYDGNHDFTFILYYVRSHSRLEMEAKKTLQRILSVLQRELWLMKKKQISIASVEWK